MAERQKRVMEENEQLRKRLNDVEMQLEIYQIEQETTLEEKKNEEKKKAMMERESKQEQRYERDREFVSSLLTDIWSGRIRIWR